MKIYAITGHTYGIGKAIYNKLSPNCLGFSKSIGYDITKKEDRLKILNESESCDVFINNACDGFGQSNLCLDLWHRWKNKNKIIINVGSRITESITVVPNEYIHLLEYRMQKLTLKKLSDDLNQFNTPLKVIYKSFGYVGTSKILKKYPNFTEDDYITIDHAVNIILDL